MQYHAIKGVSPSVIIYFGPHLSDFSIIVIPKTNSNLTRRIMSLPTHFTLNTGAQIPDVGFETWQAKPGEVERAVETAPKAGYRHIDCAAIYRNEVEVEDGIRRSGVPRSEIFITGKLWNTKHAPEDVERALDKSLRDLGVEYLDLFLMHWPVCLATCRSREMG